MGRSLSSDMVRFGCLATRTQLRELGYSEREVVRAVEDQQLWPVGRRRLVHRGADGSAVRAVALGGRLAAASALATHGVWVTRPGGLWIGVPRSASHVAPLLPGEHRLWVNERFPEDGDKKWRMSLQDSLVQVARLSGEDDAIASFDSALNKRLLTPNGLDQAFAALPRRLRRLRAHLDGRADSGLEILLRLAAEAEGWRVDIQVFISGVGRVDLLIDGWLVIELDGARWHDDDASQDEDRRRDAELILLGYRWHRFRYAQVLEDMPLCLAVIRSILSGGRPAHPQPKTGQIAYSLPTTGSIAPSGRAVPAFDSGGRQPEGARGKGHEARG
jgi:very-short-patch-repair endonuclease